MKDEIKLSLTFFEAIEVSAALEAYAREHRKSAPRSVADAESVLQKLNMFMSVAPSLKKAKRGVAPGGLRLGAPDARRVCIECRQKRCELYDYDGQPVHKACLKKQVRRG